MKFTQDTTTGYTDEQLARFNAEFDERIFDVEGNTVDDDLRARMFKERADEIARR